MEYVINLGGPVLVEFALEACILPECDLALGVDALEGWLLLGVAY